MIPGKRGIFLPEAAIAIKMHKKAKEVLEQGDNDLDLDCDWSIGIKERL